MLLEPLSQNCRDSQLSNLDQITCLDNQLQQYFSEQLILNSELNRTLVSFQGNKTKALYRCFKYKEAFSASLVEYLLEKYNINQGNILDPFAGSGTTLFAANSQGINAEGIELLPIGQEIINTRKIIDLDLSLEDLTRIQYWKNQKPWLETKELDPLPELRITKSAYPEETKASIEKYRVALFQENEQVKSLLRFALLCVLEEVSYTRKDGQYLRWDYRSNHQQGKIPFNKGKILNFEQAIVNKLDEIIQDIQPPSQQLELFSKHQQKGILKLYKGSCLDILPTLPENVYNAVITSPPYCNRYDYTRTYALELALLGVNEKELLQLRQQMLSCTVENKAKDLLKINPEWKTAINITDNQDLLQSILNYLEEQKAQGLLNNNGITRMIRGYFYEMACVIQECGRVMKPDTPLIMVNDNVRYAVVSISVDLILSKIAEELGFYIENILVLPNGKGNSSQQMGIHGRESLRKCIYIWRKCK
ncbi:MAG: site-specific DNA-methyltransferase [Planktothrix agardhii LY1]|uniref:DNA methyltransferase n=1 Tax=Planktothrix agardhii TaxID=1160 RepID=UPI00242C9014|nr:DNA methyltransferase [Planktothrix agardhii]MCP9293173.1 site-specific DNA-methyltransferase [Planktothrix agardhii LY1]